MDDVGCRRCDDSGLVIMHIPGAAMSRSIWIGSPPYTGRSSNICTCRAGADVLEQMDKRRA
jgi:hypothetical protein